MKKISFREFETLISSTFKKECSLCEKQNFLNWENIPSSLDGTLEVLGEFEDADKHINKNGYTEYHPNGTNYWSKEAPFALQYYPYHESIIKKCPHCNAIFLTYTEYAGHGPQRRLRWVRNDLVYYGE
jgi:hypothetical protein